ncbi:U4/U6-U5 snRNP complex subunit prp31 [Entomophthora muscae]|uniref:U4/U6-U5 snRNP complex subunit prp31 n=2 Tax=Entomophthora muscae TaxID=34485 RepID=A0ACC2U1Z0_9FUNG|nr:U4/U6-U5 snRNP complex subunit prp31 [Entomophthora muscae]
MSDNERLLNDLEDLSDGDYTDEEVNPPMATEEEDIVQEKAGGISKLAKLLKSTLLVNTIKKVNELRLQQPNIQTMVGTIEEDPEYKLIVTANSLVAEIDTELVTVIKYIRDLYDARFRGLDTLVTNPLAYVKTVKAIGANEDVRKVDFSGFLVATTVLSINIANKGLPTSTLTPEALEEVNIACDMALELESTQQKLVAFVESRMTFIAPNLSAVVGTTTAAKLLGAAGGLDALSKIPACNLMALGASKLANTGLSKISNKNRSGYIHYSETVMSAPPDLRSKLVRIVSNKAVLAARIDRSQQFRDGSSGRTLRQEIKKKVEGMLQPPPMKNIKALPIPDEGPKKRRGGRRMRSIKESMAVTELRRAANRVNFGEQEDEAHGIDSMIGLGTMGTNRGQVRAAVADSRNKVGVSKRHRTMLAHTSSNGTFTSGLSSSLAFTPAQGIELENPEGKAQRIRDANDKYFGSNQGFRFAAPKKE